MGESPCEKSFLTTLTILAVIKKGSDHELTHYMRSGRSRGLIDRKTHLQSIRGQVDPREFDRWMQALA